MVREKKKFFLFWGFFLDPTHFIRWFANVWLAESEKQEQKNRIDKQIYRWDLIRKIGEDHQRGEKIKNQDGNKGTNKTRGGRGGGMEIYHRRGTQTTKPWTLSNHKTRLFPDYSQIIPRLTLDRHNRELSGFAMFSWWKMKAVDRSRRSWSYESARGWTFHQRCAGFWRRCQ